MKLDIAINPNVSVQNNGLFGSLDFCKGRNLTSVSKFLKVFYKEIHFILTTIENLSKCFIFVKSERIKSLSSVVF